MNGQLKTRNPDIQKSRHPEILASTFIDLVHPWADAFLDFAED
jgi:hypothetical protein